MRRFVIGDLHGAFKALVQCLEQVNFDYENDQLILLGDIADGFDQVYECVEELLKIKNRISIRGNHDDWLHEFILTEYHPACWRYGGKGTLISYLNHAGKAGKYFASHHGYKTALVSADIPLSHQRFFEEMLPYYIDNENRCFLHAGFNRHLPFFGQLAEDYYWNRDLWTEALRYAGSSETLTSGFFYDCSFKEIYIGHSSTTDLGTDRPMKAVNIYNLDTGAGHIGRLTIFNVDTKEYRQSEPVSVLYPKASMPR